MSNKKLFIFMAAIMFLIIIASGAGCKKEKKIIAAPPRPTQTPVPHMEKIVFTNNGNLYWMDPDGLAKEEIFPDTNSKWFPAISPDGFYTAYWVQNNKSYNLWVGDLKTKRAYPVTFDNDTIDEETQNFNFNNRVSFTPDSNNIVFSRRSEIWMITRDGYNLEALTDTHNCISPAVSKNNKLAYVIKENENTYNLYIKDLAALRPDKLTRLIGKKAGSPYFSPDGNKIVYTVSDGESTNIYIIDIVSKIETGLTTDGKSNSPSFSPDGKKIIYSSSRNDKYLPSVWIMNTNMEEMKPVITTGGLSPVWLYQVLNEPLPTYTPVVQAETGTKQNEIFDINETPQITPEQTDSYVPQDDQIAPFNPEELKVKTIQQGDKLLFYPVIHYDSALSNIKPEFRSTLDEMAKIINQQGNAPILIEGHTDSDPISTAKFKSNYELSVARAQAVKTYLVQVCKIDASRITITGYGDTKPLVTNDTNENKYRNRRSEVLVITVTDQAVKNSVPVTQPAAVSPAAEPTAVPTAAAIKVQTKSKKSIGW